MGIINILVLGATGMKGHVIYQSLEKAGHCVTPLALTPKGMSNITVLDVTNKNEFESFLKRNHFDVVINCIGILVKQSEERPDLATYLNSFLPRQLEYLYKDSNTRVIQLSTDCIFSGDNPPYAENSIPDGKLFYDRSKFLGEIVNKKDLTLRMSVVGPELSENGTGLFNWFMKQKGEISGFTNAMWTGVTSLVLAKALNKIVDSNISGIYHLVPKRNISKYELICLMKRTFERTDIEIIPENRKMPDKTLINTRKDFNFEIPDYDDMMKEMRLYIEQKKGMYPHYILKRSAI